MSLKSTGRRMVATGVLIIALCATSSVAAFAAPVVLDDESFRGSSTAADAWLYGGSNTAPCLTAGTGATPVTSLPSCGIGEAPGDGILRLTESNSQASYVILNTPIDTTRGLEISFDMFQYGGGFDPGDGMALMFIDGAVTPTSSGATGAGLGYASIGSTPGIAGGYAAIAFDTYGAFSAVGVGSGGAPNQANSIVVRGSEATNYQYITRVAASGSLSSGTSWDRELARRPVVVNISRLGIMSVAIDYGSGFVTELTGIDLTTINGEGSMPESLKLGFTASTGGATNWHGVQDFTVTTLAPDLAIGLAPGSIDPGTLQGSMSMTVSNDAAAGSTNDTVTLTSTLPAGITALSATGTGWSCATVGQLVTCTRAGTGADRLHAGESYPNVTMNLAASSVAALPVTITASVSIADDADAANNSAAGELTLGAALADTGANSVGWGLVLALLMTVAGVVAIRARRVSVPISE